MTATISIESVIQPQLDAYNARDIEALMATYTEDVELFEHPAKLLASGVAQVRKLQAARLYFASPAQASPYYVNFSLLRLRIAKSLITRAAFDRD